MRAARYCIMKQRLDYTSAAQELHYLLNHSRERYLWMESPDKPHKGSNWFNTLWRAFRLRLVAHNFARYYGNSYRSEAGCF